MSEHKQKNKRTGKLLLLITCGMFAFGFALVPLYRVFCQVTGLNGRIFGAAEVQAETKIDKERTVTVQFLATNNEQLDWDFFPVTEQVKVHPGQLARVSFFAKNKTDHSMTVQAIPSVTPSIAAKYLRKTECFCFTQQTLDSSQALDMPIIFHLDSELPKDISTVTISYTLFDTAGIKVKPKQNAGRIA